VPSFAATLATADLLERPLEPLPDPVLRLRPFQIVTVRISAHPRD
jgi:hypothetical protein